MSWEVSLRSMLLVSFYFLKLYFASETSRFWRQFLKIFKIAILTLYFDTVLEKFLITRGILAPKEALKDPKDIEMYNLSNQSSFLNEDKPLDPKLEDSVYFQPDLVQLNNEEMLRNTEKLEAVTFPEPDIVNYKKHLLDAFKDIEDPFNLEIEGVFDYEQNPSDPSQPQKTATIT